MDEYERLTDDLAAARELAPEDETFAAEAEELEHKLAGLTERLTKLLAPRDPNDSARRPDRDQVRRGRRGVCAVRRRPAQDVHPVRREPRLEGRGPRRSGDRSRRLQVGHRRHQGSVGVANRTRCRTGCLKFEGGVHRVQRVPVTESQGRVHTSAAGVLVMPEVEETEVEIDENDLRIDVFRSSGPGGQGVNTTDSAVRITHLPTGIVVSCQNERSQLQNREQAMRMLRARLITAAEEQAADAASAARRSQVRTVDRSERIRTYNYAENRIADHRIGFKAYNLDAVLNGDLGAVIAALQEADIADRLAHVGEA